jgi:hypothetical protein
MGKMPDKEQARRSKLQAELHVEFRKTLARKYECECKRNGSEPTLEGLIEFAHQHSLLRDTDVNRYMVFELYPNALYNNDGCKSHAIQDIEDIVPVSDRKIWSWIADLSRRYLTYRNGKGR